MGFMDELNAISAPPAMPTNPAFESGSFFATLDQIAPPGLGMSQAEQFGTGAAELVDTGLTLPQLFTPRGALAGVVDQIEGENQAISEGIQGDGKFGAFDFLRTRTKRGAAKRVPFSPQGAVEMVSLLRAVQAQEAGTANPLQQRLIQAFNSNQELQKSKTRGAKILDVVSQVPTFVLEMAATGGMKKGAEALLGRTVFKGIADRAKLSMAKKIGVKSAELLAGGVARSLVMQHRNVENIASRRLAVETGETDEAFATSILKGWGDTVIEMASEEAGGVVAQQLNKTKVMQALGKAWVKKFPNKTFRDFTKKVSTAGGYNGMLGEMGEERLGEVLRGITGIQKLPNLLNAEERRQYRDQLIVEAGAFAIPGILGLSADVAMTVPSIVNGTKSEDEQARDGRLASTIWADVKAEAGLPENAELDDPQYDEQADIYLGRLQEALGETVEDVAGAQEAVEAPGAQLPSEQAATPSAAAETLVEGAGQVGAVQEGVIPESFENAEEAEAFGSAHPELAAELQARSDEQLAIQRDLMAKAEVETDPAVKSRMTQEIVNRSAWQSSFSEAAQEARKAAEAPAIEAKRESEDDLGVFQSRMPGFVEKEDALTSQLNNLGRKLKNTATGGGKRTRLESEFKRVQGELRGLRAESERQFDAQKQPRPSPPALTPEGKVVGMAETAEKAPAVEAKKAVAKETEVTPETDLKQAAERLGMSEEEAVKELESQTFATQVDKGQISPALEEVSRKAGLHTYSPISVEATQSEIQKAIQKDTVESSKTRVMHDPMLTQTQRIGIMRELLTIADAEANKATASGDIQKATILLREAEAFQRQYLETVQDTARALHFVQTSPLMLNPLFHVVRTKDILKAAATPQAVKKRAKQLAKADKQPSTQQAERTSRRQEIKKNVLAKLEAQEAEIRKRMAKRAGKASLGVDPTVASDMVTIGALKIAKGATKFTVWAQQMIDDFGESIRPMLKQMWVDAKAKLKEITGQEAEKVNKVSSDFYVEKATEELVTLKPGVEAEIRKRVAEANTKPTGSEQQMKVLRSLNEYILNQIPISNSDLIVPLVYANMLSGPPTHIVNMADTFAHVLGEAITQTIANPTPEAIRNIWKGWAEGYSFGAALSKQTLTEGPLGMDLKETMGGSSLPERMESLPENMKPLLAKGKLNPIRLAKFITRFLSAEDQLHYGAAKEMRSRLAAYQIAKKEGLKGDALSARVVEVLGIGIDNRAAAKDQAVKEGLHEAERQRRINQLIQQSRPEDLNAHAIQYGKMATYNNNEGGGFIRVIADKLGEIGRSEKGGILPTLFRLVHVPFTRVVGNVIERKVDYTPIGYIRLFQTRNKTRSFLQNEDRRAQYVKATVGLMTMGLLSRLASEWLDDDDPFFAIYGEGPRNLQQRYQMQETGWRPWSVKMGNVYLPYQETPFGVGMAVIGSYHDAIRWKGLSEADALSRAGYVLENSWRVILDMSFLRSLQEFFNASSFEQKPDKMKLAIKAVRTARSMATPNALRWVSGMFDPKVYTQDTITEALIKDMPVARDKYSKAILNVFGEPIREDWTLLERGAQRFISLKKDHPAATFLAENNLYVSMPSKDKIVKVQGYKREISPQEYYEWVRLSGPIIRRKIEQQSERLERMDKKQQRSALNKIVSDARESTLRQALIIANK